MRATTSASLFHFVQEEVLAISPYVVLVTFTSVVELIITITMFRNISLIIGGESEIFGLAKII